MTALITAIDADKNGVVTRKEWVDILEPQLTVEVDFRNIMSNINIDDPIELEEKTLDLKFRSRRLEQELMILRSKNGEIGNLARGAEARKRAMERKLAEKVKELESKFENKLMAQKDEDASIESRIKEAMMAKDQVYQDYYLAQRQMDQEEIEHSMRLQQVQSHVNTLDFKVTEISSLIAMLKTEKQQYEQSIERQKLRLVQMSDIEQQVNK